MKPKLSTYNLIGCLVVLVTIICCDNRPSWKEDWTTRIGAVIPEIQKLGPSFLSGEPIHPDDFHEGGWVVVNELGWELAPECELIQERSVRPNDISELGYVLIVSQPRKKSAGYWKYQGSSGKSQMFVSEYTIYLVDWQQKQLVRKEIIESPKNPGGVGFWSGWEEDQKNKRSSIVAWLVYRGVVDQHHRHFGDYPTPPLQMASRKGDLQLVRYLLSKGSSANHGWHGTPLHEALENNQLEVAALLIQYGANTDILTHSGFGDVVKVKEMIRGKPELLQVRSESGNTPLHFAAANGYTEVVSLLLSAGADVNAEAYWDREYPNITALEKAARFGHKDAVELLVKCGGGSVQAAIGLAHNHGHPDVARFLETLEGNKINAR